MTQDPNWTDPQQPPPGPPPAGGSGYGAPPPPPYAPYGAPAPGFGPMGVSPSAPYGIHPGTGIPYSDKQKLVAGLLQILIPFGVGRFYIGDTGTGVAQLLVGFFTCGLWSIIDGIIMLTKDDPRDARGYVLRP